MSDDLRQQLALYDAAVKRAANQTDRSLPDGEQWALGVAAKQLAEHAPSNRTSPTCTGCNGGRWPCDTVMGATVMSDSRYN
ncbi:hypothetical protein [Streptomyces sp. NPDC059816]|uniref:hypothetical protein n=1 Tax=Streptomyces sp. NPDC059816 TaxID=3346960 RepID=UPI00364A8B14